MTKCTIFIQKFHEKKAFFCEHFMKIMIHIIVFLCFLFRESLKILKEILFFLIKQHQQVIKIEEL